jgi:hypothetical protein
LNFCNGKGQIKKQKQGSKCKNNNNNKAISLQKGPHRLNQGSKGLKTNSNNKATCVLNFIKIRIQTESPNQGSKTGLAIREEKGETRKARLGWVWLPKLG